MLHHLDRISASSNESTRITILASIVISILIGSAIASTSWSPLILVAVILISANTIAIVAPIVYLSSHTKLILLQPATIFSLTSLGYITSAIYLLLGNQSRSLHYILESQNLIYFVKALFYAFVGICCFHLAYVFSLNQQKSSINSYYTENNGEPAPAGNKLTLAVLIPSLIGLIGLYLFVDSSGGLGYLVSSIYGRTILRTSEWYRVLFQFMQAASWVWFVYDKKATRRVLFWLHFSANAVGLVILGARAPLILFVALFLVIHFFRSKSISERNIREWLSYIPILTVLGVFSLFVMISFLGWRDASVYAHRGATFSISLITEETLKYLSPQTIPATIFGYGNLTSIEAMSTAVEVVPKLTPYLYGKTILWTFIAPIPRAIWPEKPSVTIGILIRRILDDPYALSGGVPVSWIGELYVNFDIIGIILGCLIFGYFSAWAYRIFQQQQHSPVIQLLYGIYTIYFVFFLTKTELKTALSHAMTYVIPVLLSYLLMHTRTSSKSITTKPGNQRIDK